VSDDNRPVAAALTGTGAGAGAGTGTGTGAATAARLRAEFDRGFAVGASTAIKDQTTFLAIRIGGDPFALPLGGLVAIHVDRKVVPLPSASPTLLGIASFRGALTPVHDLRVILGYSPRTEARWLALVAAAVPVGLAFEAFEGQVAAKLESSAAVAARPAGPASTATVTASSLTLGLVHALGCVRPVLDVGAVLAAIGSRARRTPPTLATQGTQER
jgi:chemotaxis signal transduction protein